jgi:hypothetical protein
MSDKEVIVGPIDTLKDVIKLAQEVKNIPLYQQLLSLQTEVFGLYDENRNLTQEIRELSGQLELREKLHFIDNFYWMVDGETKDGPFCPRCYDEDHEPRRMLELGHLRGCPTCQLLLGQDGSSPSVHERNRFVTTLARKPS